MHDYNLVFATLKFHESAIVTPIISSFFELYSTDNTLEIDLTDRTLSIREKEHISYSEIANVFNENAQKLGMFEDKQLNINEWFLFLRKKFNVDKSTISDEYINSLGSSDLDSVNLHDLYIFARLFDDGHGLYSISTVDTEGDATFQSPHFYKHFHSPDALKEVAMIDSLMLSKNFVHTGGCLVDQIDQLVSQIPEDQQLLVFDSVIDILQKKRLALQPTITSTSTKRMTP